MEPYKPECICKAAYNIGYFTWLCPIHGSVALKEWLDHFKIYDPKNEIDLSVYEEMSVTVIEDDNEHL